MDNYQPLQRNQTSPESIMTDLNNRSPNEIPTEFLASIPFEALENLLEFLKEDKIKNAAMIYEIIIYMAQHASRYSSLNVNEQDAKKLEQLEWLQQECTNDPKFRALVEMAETNLDVLLPEGDNKNFDNDMTGLIKHLKESK